MRRVHRRLRALGEAPAPGMYRDAVGQGQAAPWITANLSQIEVIERKIYNRHQFADNLALAFRFPDRIDPIDLKYLDRPQNLRERRKAREARAAEAARNSEDSRSAPPAPRPNLLLVTIDTLRADRLGAYGYEAPTSPNFDRLAETGALFEIAYAPMGATSPSHATLFTSRSPLAHGLVRNGFPLAAGERLLSEVLRDSGYQTAGFVSAYPVGRKLGFARGFEHFDDDFSAGTDSFRHDPSDSGGDAEEEQSWEGESLDGGFDRGGAATVDAALRWLGEPHSKPVFLWVHLFDPHRPYAPPQRFASLFTKPNQPRRERNSALYDAEIRGVDEELERLTSAFERLFEDTLLVIAADHGEALWQHGFRAHGHTLYEEELRVPLLFRWPERIAPGRIRQPAHLIDIAPTLVVWKYPSPMTINKPYQRSMPKMPANTACAFESLNSSDVPPLC